MWSSIISYIPEWPIWAQAMLVFLVPVSITLIWRWLNTAVHRGSFSRSAKPSSISSRDISPAEAGIGPGTETGHYANIKITGEYATDMTSVKETFAKNADVHIREFMIRGTNTRAAVLYTEGLVDQELIDEHLITPLMMNGVPELKQEGFVHPENRQMLSGYLQNQLLPVSQIQETGSLQEFALGVLVGKNGLLVDGMPGGMLIGTSKGKTRSIDEPLSEALLRGPRMGFTEQLSDNTGILRRYGSDQSLFIEKIEVGSRIKKDLAIAYIQDIADPKLVAEVEKRIREMDMDNFLESGYVEQLIEDNTLSPFQQILNTERPDRVIGALLEGRVAILLDGTPFVLVVPVTFSMLLQSPEDYYERWIPGTFMRMLRFLSAMLALFAPALYISFISFHPGLIPTKLVLTIIETRTGVPFPSLIEVLIMELSIEILREAGIRLPKPIGPAMGIVGGLIIGQAAVQAGIISQFLVIVVAVTAISSFTIPVYSAGLTLRILRFAAMFSAAVLGLYGVIMFFLLICTHLARLTSFGVPYVAPAVPYRLSDWKDFIIRAPLSMMRRRPEMMNTVDEDRKK
ncbi:spore germination protein [Paenibacillus barcinonensis]|uniref:Spore germination protein n=1 Tax=Paenibacillus barcinonensis TaxID=198119 RepID=A0A2V4V9Z9_PAEBA|nr:spore germination protein [Paenibacillus barcinonensis]PYE42811.1 spore germination protein [Paenibacillus barcinonensis]QKS57177.1 spore germination protein [Paenibacillus barcinonensis]